MAYVEPNGTIQLFCNVGIDSSYRNTFWFDSIGDQTNYFSSLSGTKTYPKCYYTRKNRGYIRVKDLADHLYNYNYMRYNNYSHKNKWIYCFITSVDYINENTTQINYEVDVIQTYMFDVRIRNSFVERQHSFTDEIGDNLVEENLNIGENYLIEKNAEIYDLTPNRFCFMSSQHAQSIQLDRTPSISTINGYSGRICVLITRVPQSAADSTYLSGIVKLVLSTISDDSIVNIFMYSSVLDSLITNVNLDDPNATWAGNLQTNDPIYSVGPIRIANINPSISLTNTFGNYTAKNKKLLTYPYKYFSVLGADKDSVDYKYELFADRNNIRFDLFGAIFPFPQYALYPKNYMGITSNNSSSYPIGYEFGVKITDYPVVPFATDTFKGYLLQNRGSHLYSVAKMIALVGAAYMSFGGTAIAAGAAGAVGATAASTALTPATGTAVGQTLHGAFGSEALSTNTQGFREVPINTGGNKVPYESPSAIEYSYGKRVNPYPAICSLLAGSVNASNAPNGLNGSFTSDGLLVGQNRYHYEYFQYCIKPEYAKIIDDYFTMFGYAMKQYMGVISPSSENQLAKMHRRKLWNYTKTQGCNVISAPAVLGCTSGELDKIANIYDSGITFWNTSQPIGSYNGDNSPRA